MTPIIVDEVRQVELLERRNWDRRVRGLLATSEWVERLGRQGVSCFCFLLRSGGLQWSAKAFEAESFPLTMGHGQSFPVICLSQQGWEIYWAAVAPLFPDLGRFPRHPFRLLDEVKIWTIPFPPILGVSY